MIQSMSSLVIDSIWLNGYGETFQLLYWEKGMAFVRKRRGLDGLVGKTVKLPVDDFVNWYRKGS